MTDGKSQMTKGTVLMRVTDDTEVMVTEPGGRMRFMGWFKAIWFGWCAMRAGYKVKVDDAE